MATATAKPIAVERLPRSRSVFPSWDRLTPILLVAPSVLLIAIFVYGFIAYTGFVSMTKWVGLVPDYTFVGLRNYVRLFGLERFQADMWNTARFTALFLAGCLGGRAEPLQGDKVPGSSAVVRVVSGERAERVK